MTAQIRLATPADLPAIMRVRTSVTENHLSVEQMQELGITKPVLAQMILSAPCCWVAVVEGEIVGFSMIDNAEGALFAAFVLPAHEGRGIGRRLVQIAEDQLFQTHSRIWLETGQSTRAAGFYRRAGWGSERAAGPGDIRLEKPRP